VRTITDQVVFQDIQVRIDQKYKVRAKIRKWSQSYPSSLSIITLPIS
jgi:hypothetical protein